MKKTVITAFSVLLGLLFLQSCGRNAEPITVEEESTKVDEQVALKLMSQTCFTCHNPDMEIDNRVAPPLFKIREHYLDDETTQDEFVKNITYFINNPTEENSIMPGAVRNFGLMPKMTFKDEDIKLIAAYLFENDVASDEWYARWEAFNKQPKTDEEKLSFEDMGLKYAMGTKAILGKNLMNAIQTKGAEHAVDFCNIKAIPLTDSMSVEFGAKIKRVSDKPRNANNQANAEELSFIEELKVKIAKGEKLVPKVVEHDDKMVGYYAIETNKMCLQCHGVANADVHASTLAKIKTKYPDDKALGYKENEIRGIWVVEMTK
ncbi:MAG: DUF3365 domain-containing protein [Flavobacteriales bacterium]|nr:DUF3365 domain-containing protein [Flavobacteriales bacterium]MCB9174334.1 DUF3365 domain-containing protein [Flavobacteriales bacterium]